jgi:hypothetical protein
VASPCPATALLGDSDPQLDSIRRFRDEVLSRSKAGMILIEFYYKNSNKITGIIENNPKIKKSAGKLLRSLAPAMALLLK